MQLIFTIDEFLTLVHILREREDNQTESSSRDSTSLILQKLLNRDFGFAIDELEDLEQILREYNEKLGREIDFASAQVDRPTLLQRKARLEHIMDKVSEACATV